MDPVELTITIDRPREEVFEYLADIANHPEFTDHYLKDWRLTRVDSYGRGAGARYKMDGPFQRFGWSDLTFIKVDAPREIVAVGRGGKFNRIKTYASWTLEPAERRHPRRVRVRDRTKAAHRPVRRGVRLPPLVQAQVRQGPAAAAQHPRGQRAPGHASHGRGDLDFRAS